MSWAQVKLLVKRTPGVRVLARGAERALGRLGSRRFSSAAYWDARYQKAGNSGAGSYNRLAQYKAEVLNEFVRTHGIRTVIELGSGDGSQLLLADYPEYVGVDVSATAVAHTKALFAADESKQFFHSDDLPSERSADLSLSLDVIYHLVEDGVYEAYMQRLFSLSNRYVVVYASNFDRRDAVHVRHRRFTDWVEAHRPDFALIKTLENPYPWNPAQSDDTSFADFYFFERKGSASGKG